MVHIIKLEIDWNKWSSFIQLELPLVQKKLELPHDNYGGVAILKL